jgi:L-ascorbate metabolism protein UlaG (beta-lactamase superfamily)
MAVVRPGYPGDMTALTPSPDSLTFIGNATTVLRLGPFTLLTDPNFLHRGQFAYLGKGLVSRRLTEPACTIEDLPPLDAILLSHMHGDHWDRVAKRGLDHATPVVTTPRAARALGRQGFRDAHGLNTWESHVLTRDGAELSITALPARHAPGPARALLPPVMGSLLELRDGAGVLRLYISGDTLLVEELREIPRRVARPDVAVLHLGGTTLPGGLVVTMDAEQGADLLELIKPGIAIPVHHSDYGVFKSPLADFRAEVDRRGLAPSVRYVDPGGEVALRTLLS